MYISECYRLLEKAGYSAFDPASVSYMCDQCLLGDGSCEFRTKMTGAYKDLVGKMEYAMDLLAENIRKDSETIWDKAKAFLGYKGGKRC